MANLLPEGAWDSHVHILDPEKHSYITPRYCSPAPAQLAQLAGGCKNMVVAHASMQGPSRVQLLDTLSRGPAFGLKLRGLLGIDNLDDVTDAELDALHGAGVRGTRLYLTVWGQDRAAVAESVRELGSALHKLAARLARLQWVIAIICPLVVWASLADVLRELDPRVKVLADHFAGVFPGEEETEDFGTLLELLKEGNVFVKLSALDRVAFANPAHGLPDLAPLVKAFVEANPDRILYGSDWPHVGLGKPVNDDQEPFEYEKFRDISDEEHIRHLRSWISDDETWHKLFVTNPESIFIGH